MASYTLSITFFCPRCNCSPCPPSAPGISRNLQLAFLSGGLLQVLSTGHLNEQIDAGNSLGDCLALCHRGCSSHCFACPIFIDYAQLGALAWPSDIHHWSLRNSRRYWSADPEVSQDCRLCIGLLCNCGFSCQHQSCAARFRRNSCRLGALVPPATTGFSAHTRLGGTFCRRTHLLAKEEPSNRSQEVASHTRTCKPDGPCEGNLIGRWTCTSHLGCAVLIQIRS